MTVLNSWAWDLSAWVSQETIVLCHHIRWTLAICYKNRQKTDYQSRRKVVSALASVIDSKMKGLCADVLISVWWKESAIFKIGWYFLVKEVILQLNILDKNEIKMKKPTLIKVKNRQNGLTSILSSAVSLTKNLLSSFLSSTNGQY